MNHIHLTGLFGRLTSPGQSLVPYALVENMIPSMSLQNSGPKDPARRAGMHHLITAQRKAFKDTGNRPSSNFKSRVQSRHLLRVLEFQFVPVFFLTYAY